MSAERKVSHFALLVAHTCSLSSLPALFVVGIVGDAVGFKRAFVCFEGGYGVS